MKQMAGRKKEKKKKEDQEKVCDLPVVERGGKTRVADQEGWLQWRVV